VLQLFRLLAVGLALVLAVAACGGEKDKGGEAETGDAEAAAICNGSPLSGATKLPAGFPKPDGVTYIESKMQGPTVVVEGTFDGGIDDGYDAYERAVAGAGYDVLFKEKEEHDAEISYEGGSRSGQIALRDECGGDKILVHITNRPA
jgi:hypothetical protein